MLVYTMLVYTGGSMALPPTTPALLDDDVRPYFLWWTPCTVGELRRQLQSPSIPTRAYWLGALLREANTRDVWFFTDPAQIRALWPYLRRHLGCSRARWAWLLDIDDPLSPDESAE
jgi:hypothetical protein